jgi:hypothetical protein
MFPQARLLKILQQSNPYDLGILIGIRSLDYEQISSICLRKSRIRNGFSKKMGMNRSNGRKSISVFGLAEMIINLGLSGAYLV